MVPTKTVAALALLAMASVAAAQTSHGSHAPAPMSPPAPGAGMDAAAMQRMAQHMMPSPGDPASTREFKQADMAMMHAMAVPYTGDADVDLRTRMIPHHQGAIDMAKVALVHAKDPETRRLAQKIIDDQVREIAEMQAWLKKNGKM